jgi:small conductance mechanosensitive channel
MIRTLISLLLLAVLACSGRAPAQTALPTGFPGLAPAAAPAAPPPPAATDPAAVKALVTTLSDPAQRAKLVEQLRLLEQAQAKTKPAEPATEALGTRILSFVVARVEDAGGQIDALSQAFAGAPVAARWLKSEFTDPARRLRLEQFGRSLATALAYGAAAFWLTVLALTPPRRSLDRRRPARASGRLLVGFGRLLLGIIPISVYVFVCYAAIPLLGSAHVVTVATVAIVNASALELMALALSRGVLAPRLPALRLAPMADANAAFVHRWIAILVAIATFGLFGISAARVLGLPRVPAQTGLKIVGFAVTALLISAIVRKRRDVARWIRGDSGATDAENKRKLLVRAFRASLANIWCPLAVLYLAAIFVIWALDLEGGFDFMLRGSLATLAILAMARAIGGLLRRLLGNSLVLSRDVKERFPRLQARVEHYAPVIAGLTRLVIWSLAFLTLAYAWGFDTVAWFATPVGVTVLARLTSSAVVLFAAVAAWEIVSAVIERYLVGAVRDGTPVERGQRVRTLLPLVRNAFLIFLVIVVVLMVLSEVGLNIAPLLAGAGVIGLAVGFGAQTLVKDIINGMFILFEDTIAIGDVVDLGGGHSGAVDGLSIRAIKLRDGSGGVHTVPFGAVTSVINMTKSYAYAMFNIKIAYEQDTDSVSAVVKDIGIGIETDPELCGSILAPLEIIGLDSFGADAAVLQARIKTKAGAQWTVAREFNRRLKKRFDESGIPMAFPRRVTVTPAGLWSGHESPPEQDEHPREES